MRDAHIARADAVALWKRASLLALCTWSFGASASADRVLTHDQRILSPKKAREHGGGYRLVFENGEILLPDKSRVASVEIEGDMSEYVPQNEDEKKKLAEGYVKYRGKWMSSVAYQAELKRQFEEGKKRTKLLADRSDWSNPWTKETAHFVVRSNTSPELLDYYCDLLEAYYALMDNRIGIDPTPSLRRTKMTVNVYKSYEDFQANAAADIGASTLGYFWSYDKTLNFYHEYQEPDQSTWVGLHECTHLLTYLIDPQYEPQIWLNEAVADYFGSAKVTRDKKGKLTIEPGNLQTDRVLTVQQALKVTRDARPATGKTKKGLSGRPFVGLEELFMLSREEFDGFHYAHAWSFVYFLNTYDKGRYAKNFARFFKGLYTLEKGIPIQTDRGSKRVDPKDIRDYLLKRLGVKDVPQLEKEWMDFIEAIPIEGPEARLKRGLYSVRMFEFEQALEDLDAAIEGGTKDPRAYWARGRAKAISKGPKSGIADLEKAIELDPLDAVFRYELSHLLVDQVTITARGPSGGGLTISRDDDQPLKGEKAKREAGLAMELDPENDLFRQWFERFE